MNRVLTEKIRIGISACNFGGQVRWNHVGWDRVEKLGRQRNEYIWTPVCPEVLSGLGVPRPPMKLVLGTGDDFWNNQAKTKNRKGCDVSSQMRAGALCALDILKRSQIEVFAFMEGSPSCGVYRTTLKDKRLGRPPGVFGSLLLKQEWFLFPVLDIESPWKLWDWSRRLHAFVWLKRFEITTKSQMYEAWHMLKFICQEVDTKSSKALGSAIAGASKKCTQGFINNWKTQTLQLLRKPSSLKRIQAIMVKHYAHYRKIFGISEKELSAPSLDMSKHKFVDQLQVLERKAFDQGYVFAGNPIWYRPSER